MTCLTTRCWRIKMMKQSYHQHRASIKHKDTRRAHDNDVLARPPQNVQRALHHFMATTPHIEGAGLARRLEPRAIQKTSQAASSCFEGLVASTAAAS